MAHFVLTKSSHAYEFGHEGIRATCAKQLHHIAIGKGGKATALSTESIYYKTAQQGFIARTCV